MPHIYTGILNHGRILRIRGFQQPQPAGKWCVILPAHEDSYHASRRCPTASVLQRECRLVVWNVRRANRGPAVLFWRKAERFGYYGERAREKNARPITETPVKPDSCHNVSYFRPIYCSTTREGDHPECHENP